jgi:hypothetical protein
MTSPQHAAWIRDGEHWQLAQPLAALRDRLRGYGYIVYDLGDKSHLDHQPPEDHTPYSETGWPGKTPYGWVTAIDIMPPPTAALPSLQALGRQIFDDKQIGLPSATWLKYMNWGPSSDSSAVHDQWEPDHVRTSSGDAGHIHLSCRSDATQWVSGNNYDPVARLRGQTGDEMDRQHYDLLTALAVGITEKGFVAVVGDPNTDNANIDAVVKESANYTLKTIVTAITQLKTQVEHMAVTPTDAQWAALTSALEQKFDSMSQTALVAALQSPDGQAALLQVLQSDAGQVALVRANETSEDS